MSPILSHSAICVKNICVTSSFYCNVFGFVKAESFSVGSEVSSLIGIEAPVKINSQFLRRENFALDLMEFESPGWERRNEYPINSLGLINLAFIVDSIDDILEKVVLFGGSYDESRKLVNDNGVFIYCFDPNGIMIELMEIRNGVFD